MLRIGLMVLVAVAAIDRFPSAAQAAHSSDELAAWLDERFTELWKESGAEPASVDDATFLRRVYLDLLGTIPSVAKTRDFLNDPAPDKRKRLVEQLTAEPKSAAHLSRVWRRIMVPGGSPNAVMAMQFEPWLRQQFAARVPFDEFARRLLTAKGTANFVFAAPGANPQTPGSPVAFYMAVGNTPDSLASSFSRVFLGVRIGCAKCHNHPFADWRQEDFWGMAAFFAGANLTGQPGAEITDNKVSKIKPMESDKEYEVRFLWSEDAAKVPDDKFPREVLADWLVSKQNPNFAATIVNRTWQQLCGQGLVPQVDDLDQAPTRQRAQVLDELGQRFAESDFDLYWLIEGICKSRVYQRPSEAPEAVADNPLTTHRPLKTLSPEQVFDAMEQALMLPVSRGDQSPRYNGQRDQLIGRLNEATSDMPDQFRAGIPQALLIMQGALTSNATDLDESRTLRAVVDAPFLESTEKIETLFLAALTRKPNADEMARMRTHLEGQESRDDRRRGYAEIYWALLNSPEFILCR